MAYLSGADGRAEVGAAAVVVNVKNWSLDFGRNVEDTTALGDSWDESYQTTGRWSGSLEVDYDNTDTAGQVAIQTAILSGDDVALKLFVNATKYFGGNAKFTGALRVAAKALQTATLSFTGNGQLQYL